MHDYDGEGWRFLPGDDQRINRGDVAYLCGPISGIPDGNKPAFLSAQYFLEHEGISVLNPASLPMMPPKRYMPVCMAMLEQADVMVRLPGWKDSGGAITENMYAAYQKKRIVDMERVDGDG